jgi:hypothetical protein
VSVRFVKDLVVLAADKNMELAVRGLLSTRAPALGIRKVSFDTFSHPERDPGCRLKSHEFLRGLAASYAHSIVLFDRDGCGAGGRSRAELETEVAAQLETSGWANRAAVVVLDPELEVWVWAQSPHVEQVLGWRGTAQGLRLRLVERGFWNAGEDKPHAPKEAVEYALWLARKPRSSAIYQRLAETVTLAGCADEAFSKLRSTLSSWFRA